MKYAAERFGEKMKKMTLFSIVMLMALMTAAAVMAGNVSASPIDDIPVSTGLCVIAGQSSMGKYGVSGGEIMFSPEDFERGLNLNRVDYITFKELPSASVGSIRLGSEGVSVGQSVPRNDIHKLSFVPKGEGVCEDSFVFSTGNGYDIECALFMLDRENYSPMAGMSGELSLHVSTYRNVSVWGSLSGSDADGDSIRYEIVSYPQKGLLTLTDATAGEFKYTPGSDYTGKDSFRYVVVDKYGNYSAASEVSLKIDGVQLDSVLSDMGGNRAHSGAITMVEAGIMEANKNALGELEFLPTKAVSREEFLVMAMKAVGIEPQGDGDTGFADDGDISASARGYVAFAKEKGYVNGVMKGDECYFYPKDTVTSAEAAVIIDNMIGADKYVVNDKSVLSVFADFDSIPSWAEESILTLKCVGIINGRNGYLYPQKELTREDTAMMLSAVMRVVDRELK